jgi:hypothetical protein
MCSIDKSEILNGAPGAEFGVSGLLYRNNLIIYDRNTEESLWPQMARGARCGVRHGSDLVMFPTVEMTWTGWRALHPRTRVVSSETEFDRSVVERAEREALGDTVPAPARRP